MITPIADIKRRKASRLRKERRLVWLKQEAIGWLIAIAALIVGHIQ